MENVDSVGKEFTKFCSIGCRRTSLKFGKKSTFRKKVEALMVLIYPINKHKVLIIREHQRKNK